MDNDQKIIAAVKDREALTRAVRSKCTNIFLLFGDISSIKKLVEYCHKFEKKVYVHLDMLEGFGKDEAALRFINTYIKPDGVITTKPNLIKFAKIISLKAVFRVFIVDTLSLETSINNINRCNPEFVEIMPGIIPSVIKVLQQKTKTKFICGGLVKDQIDCDNAFNNGAIHCSTSAESLWK